MSEPAGAVLIDGRAIAAPMRSRLQERCANLRLRGVAPRCAVIGAEQDAGGMYYSRTLQRIAAKLGIEISIEAIEPGAGTERYRVAVARAAADRNVHGILLQRPLPKSVDEFAICFALPPAKDVDCAHPDNLGLLFAGKPKYAPATAAAVLEILQQPAMPALRGARICVIGRSLVIGRPAAALLTAADATVTLCHSRTRDLPEVTREADVLVAAIGKPHFVGGAMVKGGAIVVDVGTTTVDGVVHGDVDPESVAQVASMLTPVPGGVGPVTVAKILENVVAAADHP